MVLDFFPDDLLHLFVVLLQGHYDADVFGSYTDAGADGFQTSGAGRVLSSGHGGGFVVGDDDGDVGVFVDAIQQSRHARVGEGGVADDGYGRMQAGIRSTLRHGDGGAHIHARVNGVEWGIGSQRVATNVAEHLISGIFFFQYLGQHRVHVAVTATLAQSGRAHLYQRRNAEFSLVLLAYGTCHAVRVQLSVL